MNYQNSEAPVTIAIAEDDDGHARLIAEHFKDSGITNPLVRLHDGQETLDFFFRRGPGPTAEPDKAYLLLLDIKMPKVDGMEVLRRLKMDPERRVIPVVVMTSSREQRDIVESYHLGANSYVVKPVQFDAFLDAVTRLGIYWMRTNQAP